MIVMLDMTDMDAFMRDYAGPLHAPYAKHGVEHLNARPSPPASRLAPPSRPPRRT